MEVCLAAEPWRIIDAGVDTLELSTATKLGIPRQVDQAAALANRKGSKVQVAWMSSGQEWTLEVEPGGGPGSSYVLLRNAVCALTLPRSLKGHRSATLKVFAEALWQHGPQRAAELVIQAVADLCYPPHQREPGDDIEPDELAALDRNRSLVATPGTWKVSRVDFCADIHAHFEASQLDDWHSKARKVDPKWTLVEPHYSGRFGKQERRFTGWTFGQGGVFVARIYDKREEIAEHNRQWVEAIWQRSQNYDPTRPVWRVEFQCRRGGARELVVGGERFDRLPSVWRHQAPAWRYLSDTWLWLARSAKHDKSSALDERWRHLSERAFTAESLAVVAPAVRTKVQGEGELRKLLPQIRGLMARVRASLVKEGLVTRGDLEQLGPDELLPVDVLAAVRDYEERGLINKRDDLELAELAVARTVSPLDEIAERIWGAEGRAHHAE